MKLTESINEDRDQMKQLNAEHIKRVNNIINSCPYLKLISMEITEMGIGYSIFEIDIQKKHFQPYQVVHGGVFASIVDATAFWALYCDIDDQNSGLTTVDLKLNFLAPAVDGKLIARGRQIKLGRTLGYADAEVTNEKGKLLAHGTATFMIQPGKGLTDDPPLPPKFL